MMRSAGRLLIQKRLFQIAVAVGGCVPVAAGLAGVLRGPAMIQAYNGPDLVALDSHFRYLSGLLLGIGLGFWSTVPVIDRPSPRFTLLALIVVIGGVGRLIGAVENGLPDAGMRFGLGMELIVTPLLSAAQITLARRSRSPDQRRQ